MSATFNATKALINKSEGTRERYGYRERFGEFVIKDGTREMATCNNQSDAQDIVDALNLLWKQEGIK